MIELKNDLCEIGRLSEKLEHFAEAEQLPLKTGLELNLVLEEVITNIISYGYADDAEHIIKIGIEKNGSMLTVTVTDDGVPFDPLKAPPPTFSDKLDDLEPGGLGIHLVLKLTDDAVYERVEELNILTLKKSIPAE